MNIQEKTTKGFGSGLAGVLSARSHRKLQLKKHKMSIKSSQKMTKLKLKAQARRHKLSLNAKSSEQKRRENIMKPHVAQKTTHLANQDRRREEKHKSTEVRAQHKHVQTVTHNTYREERAKEKHSWAKERHDSSMGKTGNMTALHVNREKRASEKHQWAADRHRVHLKKQAIAAIPAHQKLSKDEIKDLEVRKGAEEFANKHKINQSMHHWAKQREQAKHHTASTTNTSSNHNSGGGVTHDKGGGTLGSRPKEFTPIDRRKPEAKKPVNKPSKPSTTRAAQLLARVQSREQERKKSQVNKPTEVKKVSKPSIVIDKQKELARKKRADQLKLMKSKMKMRKV